MFWTVLSLISLLDTTEEALISLVIPYLRCEWNLTLFFEGTITVSVFLFYGISSMIFGKAADKYGRRTILLFILGTLTVTAIFCALSTNKWQFLVARTITGACIGANFGAIVSFASEVVPVKYRSLGTSLIIFVSKVGMFLTAVTAYFFLNSLGWKWFIIIVSLPIIPSIILLLLLPESPRYLIVSGKQKDAQKAIKFMTDMNKVQIDEGTNVVCKQSEDLGEIRVLFEPEYRKETILLSIVYFGNILVFLSLILFLPLAINSPFCGRNGVTHTHECKMLSQESILKVAVVSATMVGLIAAHAMSHFTGRIPALCVHAAMAFISSLFLYKCFSATITIIIFYVIEFASSGLNILIWIILLENYPTYIRTTASGFVNFWGKVGGVLGVVGVYASFHVSPHLLVTMYVASCLMSLVGAALFTKETRHLAVEDITDQEVTERTQQNIQ